MKMGSAGNKITLFQCRRFQFFDLEKVDLDISIKEHLKGSLVRCGSSGRGRLLVGDSEGCVHSISRNFETRSVAHSNLKGIIQLHQLKGSPYVVTLGEDEDSGLHSLKVWDEGPMELDPNKQLLLKKVIRFSRPSPPTCFAVHENLTLLAVGFEDGEIQLYRGELTRERNIRARILLHEGDQGAITGLSFSTSGNPNSIVLFVSARNSVILFDVTQKDKEIQIQVSGGGGEAGGGGEKGCVTHWEEDHHLIVGRNDAVFCYTREGLLGPSFGFDGEKHLLYAFRGYLLIIARLARDTYSLTIFDLANKFVAFGSSLSSPEPISLAVSEWGTLFLLTKEGTFWQLKEKDLQTKMSVFYKKNHYDLAIRVAKNNNFDAEGMADIFRQYGDHLYNKGDLDGAIKQYSKTVGKLVPSYVVRKYLDASRVVNLLEYLEVIHKQGYATSDLTTLLLNCLTKLKKHEKIEHYVKDPSCDFLEPETAIQVFRKGGMHKQAYQLAKRHGLYGPALQILLEDVRDPCKEDLYEILENIIISSEEDKTEQILRRYGSSLIQIVTEEEHDLKTIIGLLCKSNVKRDLIDLFIPKKEILIPLLEDIAQEFTPNDGPLMNLLLEAYLEHWSKAANSSSEDLVEREKILALLTKAPNCPTWDWSRALLACKMSGFNSGEIIAYEKLGLYPDLFEIRYRAALATLSLWPQFLQTVRKYAGTKPTLWKDAFLIITTTPEEGEQTVSQPIPDSVVEEILTQLMEENLMEPLPILEKLCGTRVKLGAVRKFLMKILDRRDVLNDEKAAKKLMEDTQDVRNRIQEIRTKPTSFQSIRCNACSQKLDLPSVHFLCQHSFHQHCFDSYAINDKDCLVCIEKQKKLLEEEGAQRQHSKGALDADFILKLSNARSNSFQVLADFFSKGIFRDENPQKVDDPKKGVQKLRVPTEQAFENSVSLPGKVTEARLRLHEGSSVSSRSQESLSYSSSIPKSSDSYMETLRSTSTASRGSGSTKASEMTRKSPPRVTGTNLPFPRVNTGAGAVDTIRVEPPKSLRQPQTSKNLSISAAINKKPPVKPTASEPKNPFEEEDEDAQEDKNKNNPFFQEGGQKKSSSSEPKNPFEEEDDYDPSLNPFAE